MAPAGSEGQRPAAADPALKALVEAEQIRLIVAQARHVTLSHFLLDVFVAGLAWRAGVGEAAWIWLGVMTFVQVGRTVCLVMLQRSGRFSVPTMLKCQAGLLVAIGAVFASMMVMVFARPSAQAHFVLTMVLTGNAAGAVATVAGHLRTYLIWAAVYGGTLCLCWLSQRTAQGAVFAGLTTLLFVILSLYVRDQGRTLLRLVTLTEDLRRERDKQAQLSEALRHERDRAERASEAKTRFFASASHDLRQPLTALSYHAATVQALAANSGDETLTQVGAGIGRALAESRTLLDSLLEVSKLDAGVIEAERTAVDICALLNEVGDSFAAEAEERRLQLRVRVPAGRPLYAETDPTLLRRILQNLVGNALKFTPQGDVSLQARAGRGPQTIEIRVADTGIGIPTEAQERVFEEFYQVGNPARNRSRGLGLGLSIVRRLAALLGTQVEVSSTPGQGSAFWFTLPAIPDPSRSATTEPGPSLRALAPLPDAPRRILVLDDEVAIRDSLTTMLRAYGWDVAAEASGEEALARVADGFAPDALIIDFRLRGGESGLQTLDELRAAGCRAPAWLITGDTEPRRITEARAAGVPVIYKPVDGVHLATLLREAFDRNP